MQEDEEVGCGRGGGEEAGANEQVEEGRAEPDAVTNKRPDRVCTSISVRFARGPEEMVNAPESGFQLFPLFRSFFSAFRNAREQAASSRTMSLVSAASCSDGCDL